MSEFRVTFGCKYATESHPTFGAAHPDGWVAIIAPDEDAARRVAVAWFGTAWAFLYGPQDIEDRDPARRSWDDLFPRGELLRIEPTS